ncbi:hypothetical protein K450DRAFT_249070 [Umbelopsis ramanniana AG]|uniref:Uncharacterized protein n=1 Tax=Umbelopsis ramanniana AG TaxID=1314678 RepID=A0AAD5E733_UMBRA|nr:uncharacterized protein K450DRAFT_249070 [Umbelopsis ramanniana AG]KAI8578107.1 hypothetical protein K450DRAFT_249070 [Umbelopsis ramanniana AG]
MHFIREAFRRKPLEKTSLVWVRGITAVGLTCIFAAYFLYLCIQLYEDQPLIKLLAQNITDTYVSPDVEMCSANSNLRLWYCDIVAMNWTSRRVPNCTGLIQKGAYSPTMYCQIFQSNGSIAFGLNADTPDTPGKDVVRRVDFYWQIDNLTASVSQTLSVPAISVQLYAPQFNPWYTNDVPGWIPRQFQAYRDITMGVTKATAIQRHSTNLIFTPSTYKAIRPSDFGALFGLAARYVDIPTISTDSIIWPLHFNPNFSNGMMTGHFSIQLGSGTMNVQQEQRQNTILSLLALTGGAFGLLNIIYVMLFGMTRLAPWGVVHYFSFFFDPPPSYSPMESDKKALLQQEIVSIKSEYYNVELERATSTGESRHWAEKTEEIEHPLPRTPVTDVSTMMSDEQSVTGTSPMDLEARVQELELILANYFLDTKHLDRMRRKSNRRPSQRHTFTGSISS